MADRCRACNRKLIWGTTAEGKHIPLDAVSPVYRVIGIDGEIARAPESFVSHFSTCPDANQFSAHKKQEASNV